MQHYYKMTIAGLERSLPICRVSDELYIGAFVIFGDAPLTVACARDLLAKAPEYDYLITAEAKGIPLAHEMAQQHEDAHYFIARKHPKLYMTGVFESDVRSITTDADHSLTYIASTFDPYDQVIRDGIYEGGRKIISFCGVLQQDIIPLPRLLQMSMKYGAEAMRRPVEIEFACNINDDRTADFYLLQIRPIVDSKQMLDEDVAAIADDKCLLRSHKSLGHGVVEDVVDVVYVKYDDNFTAANNYRIADDIERINRKFLAEDRGYVLVGPGRWGSSDSWLGIPVKWPHISAARVIAEVALKNYRVDPSQGTHFFQNLTSFGVGYFTIDSNTNDGIFRKDILDAMPAVGETDYVRHVRFPRPFRILMDGMKQEGAVVLND